MVQTFPNHEIFKMIIRPYIQPEMFSLALKSMKMHLNVFLVSTIARLIYHRNNLVSFREWGWEADSLPHHLENDRKKLVMKSGTIFH